MIERIHHDGFTAQAGWVAFDRTREGDNRELSVVVMQPSGQDIREAEHVIVASNKVVEPARGAKMLERAQAMAEISGVPVVLYDRPASGHSSELSSADAKRLYWGGPQAVINQVLEPVVTALDLRGRTAQFVGTSAAGPWAAAGSAEAHLWDMAVSGVGLGDATAQRNVLLPLGIIQYGLEKRYHPERHHEDPPLEDFVELAAVLDSGNVNVEVNLPAIRFPSKRFTLDALHTALQTQAAVEIRQVVPAEETFTTPGRHKRAAQRAVTEMVNEQNATGKRHTHTVIEVPGGHGAASSVEAYRMLVSA